MQPEVVPVAEGSALAASSFDASTVRRLPPASAAARPEPPRHDSRTLENPPMENLRREKQIPGSYGTAALRLSPVAGLKRYMTSSVAPRQHPPTADGHGDAAAGRGVRAHTHTHPHDYYFNYNTIHQKVLKKFQAATGVSIEK